MTRQEALEVVLSMAEAYYGREPSYPDTLARQHEAINILHSRPITPNRQKEFTFLDDIQD